MFPTSSLGVPGYTLYCRDSCFTASTDQIMSVTARVYMCDEYLYAGTCSHVHANFQLKVLKCFMLFLSLSLTLSYS